MLHQIPHLLDRVLLRRLAGSSRNPQPPALHGVFRDNPLVQRRLKDHVQHHARLVLGSLSGVHAVEQRLNVVGRNVLNVHLAETRIDVTRKLPLIRLRRRALDVRVRVNGKPVLGICAKVVSGLGGHVRRLRSGQLHQVFGVFLLRACGNPPRDAVYRDPSFNAVRHFNVLLK